MTDLLARYGECLFWFGRYLERTACLARLLEVQTSFDRGRSARGANWSWILTLYDDHERFGQSHAGAQSERVVQFYVSDSENPGSIVSSIRAARENARTLRALIPTELWHQVNAAYNRFRALPATMLTDVRLSHTCQLITKECYAQLGVADATLYRDEGWIFFQLGLLIERADQMSRLLDVRFAQMRFQRDVAQADLGDFGFWSILLRSLAAHQAYMRAHPGRRDPESVARFLIFDPALPRSIAYCTSEMEVLTTSLRRDYNLLGATKVLAKIYDLSSSIDVAIQDPQLITGLHDFNDHVQRNLMALTDELARQFFAQDIGPIAAHAPADRGPMSTPDGLSQHQSQTSS